MPWNYLAGSDSGCEDIRMSESFGGFKPQKREVPVTIEKLTSDNPEDRQGLGHKQFTEEQVKTLESLYEHAGVSSALREQTMHELLGEDTVNIMEYVNRYTTFQRRGELRPLIAKGIQEAQQRALENEEPRKLAA
jgi:hypothetical protein